VADRVTRVTHAGLDAGSRGDKPYQEVCMTEKVEYKQLTREELNKLAGEELPERVAMSLINANVAVPINAAIALNVLSDNSAAYGNAH
jgi:hypothetical protein